MVFDELVLLECDAFCFFKMEGKHFTCFSRCFRGFVGYFDEINSFLSLSRTFVFFPFFLLGYYFKVEYFERIKKFKYRYASIFILVSVFVLYYFIPDFDYKWLFGSRPYDELDFVYIDGGIIRIGVYGLATISLFSFLALIPRNRYFFTKWGTSSIYVYLLHGFFIQYFRNSGLEGILTDTAQILLLTIISFGLVALLSSKTMTRITQPLIEPELRIERLKNTE